MIKTLLDQFVNANMVEIDAVSRAIQLIGPTLLFFVVLWYFARFCQWLIDLYTVPRRPAKSLRTASAEQIERDVERLQDSVPGWDTIYVRGGRVRAGGPRGSAPQEQDRRP
jgi:hypothetical protein